MQSATVTVRSMPGAVVTHPSIPSTWIHPRPAPMRHDLDAVDLIAQRPTSGTPGSASAEGAPAAHDLADRRVAPEAEIESATGLGPPPGDPGDEPVAAPVQLGELEPGHRLAGTRRVLGARARLHLPIHPLDLRAERTQALVDPLVAALDLAHVVDRARALRGERREEHRHAGPDVR